MSISPGSIAASAIESFFEDEEFEALYNRSVTSGDEGEDYTDGEEFLHDLEAELFDAIEDFEEFDLN